MRKHFFLIIGGLILLTCACIAKNTLAQKNTNPEAAGKNENDELNVSLDFWQKQKDLALERRNSAVGDKAKGVIVPKEFSKNILPVQKKKLNELLNSGFVKPWDFADLAQKRINGEFVELPMATQTFVIDTGDFTKDEEFSSFDVENGRVVLKHDSAKYLTLKTFADNFSGKKYDLKNQADRRQIRQRLLRMLNPQAKTILEKIAQEYWQKFNRPLLVTELAVSIDYQILTHQPTYMNKDGVDKETLSKILPPHASGLCFDISFKQMTAEEQNFLMASLAKTNSIDVIRENFRGAFHILVLAN